LGTTLSIVTSPIRVTNGSILQLTSPPQLTAVFSHKGQPSVDIMGYQHRNTKYLHYVFRKYNLTAYPKQQYIFKWKFITDNWASIDQQFSISILFRKKLHRITMLMFWQICTSFICFQKSHTNLYSALNINTNTQTNTHTHTHTHREHNWN
jgi:hypothetical protein